MSSTEKRMTFEDIDGLILECLAEHSKTSKIGLISVSIASKTGLNLATVTRHLLSLLADGKVKREKMKGTLVAREVWVWELSSHIPIKK